MANENPELEKKAREAVKEEYVVWFTTVDTKIIPHTRPVWFVWDKGGFLIFSQPTAFKLKHIKRNPNVILHFNSDQIAEERVVIYQGVARIDDSPVRPHQVKSYLQKYKSGIERLGSTPEEFSEGYSVAIRITPTALRGW